MVGPLAMISNAANPGALTHSACPLLSGQGCHGLT